MPTECIPEQLEFEAFDRHRVVTAFDGGAISTDADALLLRHCASAIRLFDRVASCFIDHRTPELVVHELPTLVGQRICGIALGYEDLNDHDQLATTRSWRCCRTGWRRSGRIARCFPARAR